MAGPNKKSRKPAEPKSGDESESEESESGTYHGQQEVQATFEGRNPEGQDFHGIKQLLKQLFLKAHLELSEMSDMLISQNGVGSVLKQTLNDSDDEEDTDMVDDSDVFGITSVLRLTSNKNVNCIQQLYALIEEMSEKHASKEIKEKMDRIIKESNNLGFIINERFVNIPAKISTVMLSSLYEEIERKKKKDATYNFDYLVLICKTCRPKGNVDKDEIFSNDEEVIFSKAADVTFDFSVENATDTGLAGRWLSEDEQVIPYRRVLIFNANKFQSIISQVTTFVQ